MGAAVAALRVGATRLRVAVSAEALAVTGLVALFGALALIT
jgi:hypothetical protein